MPFIGQQPITGAYHKLDSITTSATATYNLQLNGGAYSPTSANHLLVSLNGVMQAPQDSFTVSGSQITFASALTSSDSIDFIMALGDVLDIGVPSDGTVNTSQLANSAVTDAKIASGITSSKLTGALPAVSGASLTDVATLDSNDQLSLVTHPVAQTIRHLGTSNANRAFVQTEVLSGTLGTSWTNILTLTPNSTSNAWYRNIMEVSCSGHHNGVGNGAVWNARFYFDCNNSTLSAANPSTAQASGNNPSFQVVVSGSSFILQGQVGSNSYHGVYEVKFHISQGQGGGAPSSWTITRGTL
jgi:hypothetical protein